jgi:polar amino acid transport system substrate-binding protein
MKRASVLVLSLVVALCLALPLAGCSSSNYTPQLKEQSVNDSALNSAGTLRVGINASNPPYAAQSNGSIVGIDVDIAAALADELGLKLELVDVGTATDTAFERESVDIVMGVEEANSAYWMSDEYMTEDAEAPTAAGSFKVAAQSSSMSAWEVTDHYGESCLENAGDPTAAFEMLNTGSVNYVAAESTIGQYVIHSSGIEAYPIALLQDATPRTVAVAADNTELQQAVSNALSTLVSGGVVEVIEGKWLGGHVDISSLTVIPAPAQESTDESSEDASTTDSNTTSDTTSDTTSGDNSSSTSQSSGSNTASE